MSNIQAQQWYNGDAPRYLSGFMNDKSNRLIGWVLMRQLRVKTSTCAVRSLRPICANDYNSFNEEKGSFQPGWILGNTTSLTNSSIDHAFQYQSSEEFNADVYVGNHGTYNPGGYVYEYRGDVDDIHQNLSSLHDYGWIDNQTRAVIIELSLYNPNVQLFTSAMLLVEFLSTGGLDRTTRFQPFDLAGRRISSDIDSSLSISTSLVFQSNFQLICFTLYMIFVIYLIFEELGLFLQMKWKYFRRFWSLIQVSIIVCSWTIVGIYVWKQQQVKAIESFLGQTNGYSSISLHRISNINGLLNSLFGLCCFFTTLRCVHLCQYDSHLSLFPQTFQYVIGQLLTFSLMFALIFLAFVCLFYLLFQSTLSTCSTLSQTIQMIMQMISFKANRSSHVHEMGMFLGPFSIVLLMIVVVCVYVNMFVVILNHAFHSVRKNRTDDQAMFSFAWQKFQRWIGMERELYSPKRYVC